LTEFHHRLSLIQLSLPLSMKLARSRSQGPSFRIRCQCFLGHRHLSPSDPAAYSRNDKIAAWQSYW
jgi:hypothetical protein